ncbi:leucine-rich repeat serine/threonine-protein kinase 2 isoform X2 [Nematostella vectensis]|uniref:leucine-rich repeat serine/threonine-protein kinase 2 isoform X2 n=1 Tax=Nematostella vectensis TaxID=45351 RepID=UPI0020775349|nr:leucine-rich repeat serine/threonine-protein kinase 2 isoform X2 [Nematostella vectensis]
MDLLYSSTLGGGIAIEIDEKSEITHEMDTDDYESSQIIKRQFEILRAIKENHNEEEVESCIDELAEIIDDSSAFDIKVFENESAETIVLDAMGLFITNCAIQRNGSFFLSHLIEESSRCREELIKKQVHQFVSNLMLNYSQDYCIQAMCCRIISSIIECSDIRLDLVSLGLITMIVMAMETFEEHEEFQLPALQLLNDILLEDSPAQDEFVLQGFHTVILNVLKSHKDSGEITEHGILLLVSLLKSQKATTELLHGGIVTVAMETMKTKQDCGNLQAIICSLLVALANDELGQRVIVDLGVCNEIRTVLRRHRNHADIQKRGLEVFALLSPMMIKSQDITLDHWMNDILVAMATHGDKPDVLCMACFALCKLINSYPGQAILIGDEAGQIPVHSSIMAALVLHLDNSELCQWACQTLACIMAQSQKVQKELTSKGVYIYIIASMKKHKRHAQTQQWACRALRILCTNDVDCKMNLIKEEALDRITKALFRLKDDFGVQEEALAAIACLATDIELVRHQCATDQVHIRILEGLKAKFLDFPSLVEVSLEALGVLSAAEEIPELLIKASAIPIIIKAMAAHSKHAAIQQKACILAQILARFLNETLCLSVVTAILQAMFEFSLDEAVQEEACVAFHVISQIEPQYSEILVNQCAHERLFFILENFSSNRRLVDLASQCLWHLGIQRDLKARMLLSACAGGLLKGATCLIQIGADVNAGEGTNTPLCAACKNNKEDMVQFLLSQGITDVQTALMLCLEMRHNNLVGILLQKLGHDREAGVIAWGGLKLGELRPEWLSPALSGRNYSVPLESAWGDYLREAENEWHRRLTISSDLTESEPNPSRKISESITEDELDCGLVAEQKGKITKTSPLRFDSLSGAALPYSRYDPRVVTPFSKRDTVILPRTASRASEDRTQPNAFDFLRRKSRSMLNLSELSQSSQKAGMDYSFADTQFVGDPDDSFKASCLRDRINSCDRQPSRIRASGLFEMPDNTYLYLSETPTGIRSMDSSSTLEDNMLRKTFPLKRRKMSRASLNQKMLTNASVRVIDLSRNGIGDLQPIADAGEYLFMHLRNVERLDLSGNFLQDFPPLLHEAMPKLEHMNLSHNEFETFPYCLVKCKRLKSLDLSYNKLTNSPPPLSISASILLEDLSLAHNVLDSFPEWLGEFLPGLTKLSVAGNNIKSLPSTALAVRRLKDLDISHNHIESIPEEFLKELFILNTLNVSHNSLESLPESVAPFLQNLKILKMSYNNLAGKSRFHIPRFILMLPNLKELDLSNNKLTHVPPPEAWTTRQLKELILAHNKIKSISLENSTGKWSNLERLVLSHNNLKCVPRGIGDLTSLTSLDLSYNPSICFLPDEMGKLCNLWDLQLNGLKLDLDDSMQGKSKELIAFLHSKLMNSVPYYRMKLVTVGMGGRGKTTLLNQLLKSKASAPHNELIIRDWAVRDSKATCKFCHHRSVIYTISTWDYKGRDDLHHVFQCLMSSRTLYLAVYDVSKGVQEFESLRSWLLNIYACAPDAPVMLVGTHLDKVPKDKLNEVLQSMRDKAQSLYSSSAGLPEIKAHVVLNCTAETPGIQALRNRIVNLIVKCKCKGHSLLGSRVPQAFVRLQQLVLQETASGNSAPFLYRGDLRRLLQDKEDEVSMCDSELGQAVKFLHEAGVLVHYDDPVAHLSDVFFVKPEWLCHVISSVVTTGNDKGLVTNGILKRDDLHSLFKPEVGSHAELMPQLLRLLERSGVLLPVNSTEFLMPSRLSRKEPTITLPNPSPERSCRRLYDLAFVPPGFWARLIARLLLFARSMISVDLNVTHEDEPHQVEPALHYWCDGVYATWEDHAYFLVNQDSSETYGTNILSILVPNTKLGFRLLGNLTDHVDVLIEEWFPSLNGVDPVQCLPLVSRLCPCLVCEGEYSHAFALEDCTEYACTHEYVTCPKTSVTMPLQHVAPDVVLADLDQQWMLDSAELCLEEKKENVLGDGGYGTVYKAKYYGQFVAVKVFRKATDVCPHRLLRQEVPFLSRLRHPSIINMIGVALKPRALVLELAPLGSLSSLLSKGEGLSRGLQHRIALQVAEGLAYLHKHMIVYRDLKPHNILIFSLSLGILINAKISDYGIARYATLYGLTAPEGTPGYRAPEVARGDVAYNKEADMYSFGMFLYELVTGGKRPFEDLRFRSELDAAVVQGRMVEPITDSGCPPWPDVSDMIEHLLEPRPDLRPTAQEVFERLYTAELVCLKRDVVVCKGQTVECMAVRHYTEGNTDRMEVWTGSGLSDNYTGQVSWFDIADTGGCRGTLVSDKRIMCITAVHSHLVVAGTQSGTLWIFDAWTHKCLHSLPALPDAVLCLRHFFDIKTGQDVVVAGLADGKLAVYQTISLQKQDAVPHMVTFCRAGSDATCQDCASHPIACITQARKRLYVGCGNDVIVVQPNDGFAVERRWSVQDRNRGLVNNIAVGVQIWTSTKDSPSVDFWDVSKVVHHGTIDCRSILEASGVNEDSHEMRVVCMLLHRRTALWVGLGGGHVIVLSPTTCDPLCVINRHVGAVRCLALAARRSIAGRPVSFVLSGGMGFRERPGYSRKKADFGYVLVWEADIGEQVLALNDDRIKREECIALYSDE